VNPILSLYRGLTQAAAPLAGVVLRRRARAGKEDLDRLGERFGHAERARPVGPLLWVHAASVGEATSVLPLLERCLADNARLHVLMTTGTVTSARLLASRLGPRMIHQYVPIEVPSVIERFLDHWRPDAAIWVESELWPSLIEATFRGAIPMALVNGRMSARSFRAWRALPHVGRTLLRRFRVVLAQSSDDQDRFARLGVGAFLLGNLKEAAPPLPADVRALAQCGRAVGGRPIWVAASTHATEEAMCAEAHARLAPTHPGLLTVIVPRHPERGPAIARALAEAGHAVTLRSTGADPSGAVYVADTLGELGLFYRLGRAVFIGGSLIPHGGHNPLEPARLGRPVLFGPHMTNFSDAAGRLIGAGAAAQVADAAELARALDRLLRDADLRDRYGEAALAATGVGEGVIDRTIAALEPLLAPLARHDAGA
jgi:3-deoxy-D-manno-octulosonic-acid transferase